MHIMTTLEAGITVAPAAGRAASLPVDDRYYKLRQGLEAIAAPLAWRGINETMASLVLAYIGIAIFNHLVEGPLRDPSSLNKPSTFGIGDANMVPALPGTIVHPGLLVGVLACVLCWVLVYRTS